MLVNIEEHSKKCTLRCMLNKIISQLSTIEKVVCTLLQTSWLQSYSIYIIKVYIIKIIKL